MNGLENLIYQVQVAPAPANQYIGDQKNQCTVHGERYESCNCFFNCPFYRLP